MREPLLEVSIPDAIATLSGHYLSGDRAGPKLVILLQVYDDVGQQTNVAEVCARLAKDAGVRLMTVENAGQELAPEQGEVSVERLIKTKSISAGLSSVLNSGRVPVEAWGVDDMEKVSQSHACMSQLFSLVPARERSFGTIRQFLRQLQEILYPPPLARLRRTQLKLYAETGGLAEQAGLLRESAQSLGVPLGDYPALARFLDMQAREKQIDSKRAEVQKAEFLKRVMGRIHGWYKTAGKNRVNIDLKKVEALLEFWMEKTNQPAAEIARRIDLGGAEPVFRAMKEWYDNWILEFAGRQSGAGAHVFFEELMRFSLRAGVSYFDLLDFRQAIALQRDTAMVKSRITGEIADCTEAVAGKLNPAKAGRFREAEDEIDGIYRALALGVPPEEAERANLQTGALSALLAEAAGLARCDVPEPVSAAAQAMDPALEAASSFLTLSRERGERMVSRTLELMEQRKEDRAVLVTGGFHRRAITRALEDHPQVSWSVLIPSLGARAASAAPGVL